jgi:hypothetical protein
MMRLGHWSAKHKPPSPLADPPSRIHIPPAQPSPAVRSHYTTDYFVSLLSPLF